MGWQHHYTAIFTTESLIAPACGFCALAKSIFFSLIPVQMMSWCFKIWIVIISFHLQVVEWSMIGCLNRSSILILNDLMPFDHKCPIAIMPSKCDNLCFHFNDVSLSFSFLCSWEKASILVPSIKAWEMLHQVLFVQFDAWTGSGHHFLHFLFLFHLLLYLVDKVHSEGSFLFLQTWDDSNSCHPSTASCTCHCKDDNSSMSNVALKNDSSQYLGHALNLNSPPHHSSHLWVDHCAFSKMAFPLFLPSWFLVMQCHNLSLNLFAFHTCHDWFCLVLVSMSF